MPLISIDDAKALERAIDEAQRDLQPLNNFIHPGGSYPGAFLHLARTICRRAERLLVTLRETDEDVSKEDAMYLNRLSDALFVWSRWINELLHQPEHLWNATTQPRSAARCSGVGSSRPNPSASRATTSDRESSMIAWTTSSELRPPCRTAR